jgi:hypothetical protein
MLFLRYFLPFRSFLVWPSACTFVLRGATHGYCLTRFFRSKQCRKRKAPTRTVSDDGFSGFVGRADAIDLC